MSGQRWDPFVLDEDDATTWEDDTIEVHHFGELRLLCLEILAKSDTDSEPQDDDDIPEYIGVDADDDGPDDSPLEPTDSATSAFPQVFELPSLALPCGIVKPGDTVELRDTTERVSNNLISGDFLRIEYIIEDVNTSEINLKGYRLRRENTLRPQFEGKKS